MKYVIACGGTAGHINPGLSIANELCKLCPDTRILFIGAGRDLEKRLIPEAGYELINIKMSGIKRGIKPGDIKHNVKTLINVITAGRKAKKILQETQPKAVIGTGGYICYPVIKAAAAMKIPTFIHESNALPGMTVKKLSAIADHVLITYSGFEKHYKHPERIIVTGTPVREGFVNKADSGKYKKHGKEPLIVSFWGSLGAENMDEIMAGFIKRNVEDKSFHHIHASGKNFDKLLSTLNKLGVSEIVPPYTDIRRYIDNMPELINNADIIICRAGAATLAELTATGTPSVLVPSPYVPDNVQSENAMQLQKLGAAIVINESECSAGRLYETVKSLLCDRTALDNMSRAAAALAKPDAATDIAKLLLRQLTVGNIYIEDQLPE